MIQGKSKQTQCDPKAREILMIRRTFCSKEVSKESILRRSIFKTRYNIFDKFCKMMIDNGSSTNLASEEMVTKLQLQRLEHPNPYHVYWVKYEHKILVSE